MLKSNMTQLGLTYIHTERCTDENLQKPMQNQYIDNWFPHRDMRNPSLEQIVEWWHHLYL